MQPLGKVNRAHRVNGAPTYRHAPNVKRRLKSVATARQKKPIHPIYHRLWNIVACALVALTVSYGNWINGQMDSRWQDVLYNIDRLINYSGFGIGRLEIIGLQRLSEKEITSSIGSNGNQSLLGFNTQIAQDKIEALPWIRSARVMRILPSTLRVEIEEREPLAYWQFKGALYLISEDGEVIEAAEPGSHGNLPLIVGEGAPHHAARLLATLMRYPSIATRVKALVRVADRRWTIDLRDGPDILLPESKVNAALRSFSNVDDRHRLLDRQLDAIDLRIAGRITLRPSEEQTPSTSHRIGAVSKINPPSGGV